MVDIFRLKDANGVEGNWAYFSESKGEIVDAGKDEQAAKEAAEKDSPKATIASALAHDTATPTPSSFVAGDNSSTNHSDEVSKPSETVKETSTIQLNKPSAPDVDNVKPVKKRAPFSPALLKKIVDSFGRNVTNISVELERFLIKQFGFSTEELSEDDPDVELVKLGWDCICQSYMEGSEPPISLIMAFGYSCVTVRLITSAKRMEKKVVQEPQNT
jgi:hypothetical protein